MTPTVVTFSDWPIAVSGLGDREPRIRDVELAERLGFKELVSIRRLIKSLIRTGKLSDIKVLHGASAATGGRPVAEYWLTERQAIKVVAKSATDRADALLDEVIEVFVLARQGKLQQEALSDPATLRNLLGNYAERVQLLEEEAQTIRPKAEVYDRIVDSGDTVGFREACKLIFAGTGAKEHEVRTFMVKARWIQRLGGRLAPASYGQGHDYVSSRDKEVMLKEGGTLVVPELRITQRGVAQAVKRLNGPKAVA